MVKVLFAVTGQISLLCYPSLFGWCPCLRHFSKTISGRESQSLFCTEPRSFLGIKIVDFVIAKTVSSQADMWLS